MNRCRGLPGLLLGHRLKEIADEEREYYPFDPGSMRQTSDVPHGSVKSEKREHLHCVCTRCGQIVQKEKRGLFVEEKK